MRYRPRDFVLTTLSISFFLIAMQAQHQLASIKAVGNDIMINTADGKGRVMLDGDQDLKAVINGLVQENKDLKVAKALFG
jgi:hypothetical protein